jgi:hypothetical protein
VQERLAAEHTRELLRDALEHLLDRRRAPWSVLLDGSVAPVPSTGTAREHVRAHKSPPGDSETRAVAADPRRQSFFL